MKRPQLKTTIGVLYATSLIIGAITATKVAAFDMPLLGSIAVPAGFVAIGVAFLCTDLMGELYGREHARDVVNATVIGLVVAWALIYTSILMPAAPFYPLSEEFATILGGSSTIIVASITAILVSQNLDVSIFHAIRTRTGVGHKWVRNIGSTTVSQLVDTALFITLAFAVLPRVLAGEVTPLDALPAMILAQYVAKVAVALLETPLFYGITFLAE